METRNFDSSTFNAWFTAYTLDNPEKMAVAERRFRPEFRAAFEPGWRPIPENNPRRPTGPDIHAELRAVGQGEAERAGQEGRGRVPSAGERSGAAADEYVRITVILAAVLFLIGIGTTSWAGRSATASRGCRRCCSSSPSS